MKIAEFSLKHKVAVILACIMVVVFGIIGYTNLPLALLPNMEIPVAVVMTTYPNAGPEEVESQVTRPIESACASVSGMDELTSTSADNVSTVIIQFVDGTDLDEAVVDLRDKVDRVKSTLPDDADSPMIMKIDIDAMPVVQIGLRGTDLASLQSLADDDIGPYLERIAGVASVDISGGYEDEVQVNTYSQKMQGYGITISYLSQILSATNTTVPGGTVDSGSQSLSVKTDGEFQSVDEIANMMIPLPSGGGSVRLSEIAEVKMAPKDQDSIAKVNGQPCVVLAVNKQSGVNTVEIANKAKAAMEQYTQDNPTLQWDLLMDQSDYINQSVNSVIQNIIMGVVLAAIVLFVFLRRLSATAIISLSMPICIVSVFLIMQAFDITMNIMSLGGLGMGVGMIVDNSIVVLENIFRFRSEGNSRWDSCVKGTAEVFTSVVASTLTTLAVFVPLSMVSGMIGMMFKEFALTIVALITSSLVVAVLLVPLLCYMLLDTGEDANKVKAPDDPDHLLEFKPGMRIYRGIVRFFATKRFIAMLVSAGLLVVFIGGVGASIATKGMAMTPDMDQGAVKVTVKMPLGSELEETEAIADRVADIALQSIPELESVSYISSSTEDITVTVNLVDLKDRDRSSEEIANDLRERVQDIAGAELTTEAGGATDMSSMSSDALNLEISGDDFDELTAVANDLVEEFSKIPDAVDVKSSAEEQVPNVKITMKQLTASQFGLTAGSVGSMVRAELTGQSATQLKVDGDEIDVTISGDAASSKSLDALKSMQVSTNTGNVPLSLIADVNVELAPQKITRTNQTRTVTITGDSLSGNSAALMQQVKEIVNNYDMPEGITYDSDGEQEQMAESISSLGYALLVAMGLVYFVLAAQYESFLLPIMVMMILPLGLCGAMFGLPLTGTQITMNAFVGVIVLAGTVVNSSIVLIDYIQTRREMGEDKLTAILNACPRRVRPVMMTTMTTILGLLPQALGIGEGAEMMQGMSIVMITGMIVSTIVTLVFTPVYYSLLDSLSERFEKRREKRKAKKRARQHPQSQA